MTEELILSKYGASFCEWLSENRQIKGKEVEPKETVQPTKKKEDFENIKMIYPVHDGKREISSQDLEDLKKNTVFCTPEAPIASKSAPVQKDFAEPLPKRIKVSTAAQREIEEEKKVEVSKIIDDKKIVKTLKYIKPQMAPKIK